MRFEEIVKIGEIMELSRSGVCMKTKLQDVHEYDRFTVFHPTVGGLYAELHAGDLFNVRFYRPTGIFEFDAKVREWLVKDKLKLCVLEATTEVVKSQRRKSYRLPIVLKVLLWRANDDSQKPKKFKAKTVDISEHGMQLTCFEVFEKGDRIVADVKISDYEHKIFEAEVLRCEHPCSATEPKRTVLLFINCPENDRAFLGRFILRQQISARKKRVLGK